MVLSESAFNDFWRIVKLPSNGTLSLRVPFSETQGKLYLEANSQGFRGVANLGKVSTVAEFQAGHFTACARKYYEY